MSWESIAGDDENVGWASDVEACEELDVEACEELDAEACEELDVDAFEALSKVSMVGASLKWTLVVGTSLESSACWIRISGKINWAGHEFDSVSFTVSSSIDSIIVCKNSPKILHHYYY